VAAATEPAEVVGESLWTYQKIGKTIFKMSNRTK